MADRSALHQEAFKSTQILPGALELVKHLKENGVPIAIATGSNNANYKWKTVRFNPIFLAWLTSRDIYKSFSACSHPTAYLLLIREWGEGNLIPIYT